MSVDLRPGATALEAPMTVPMASTVASQWKAIGSALSQTQAVQNASIPPASWTGAAAEAASAEIQKFGTKVSGISQAFPSPVQAMEAWDERVQTTITAVQGFQAQWDEAIAKYRKDMADIDARVVADEEYRADVDRTKARAALRGAQAPLRKSYEDQIQQLDKAASDAAGVIRGTAESMVPPEVLKAGRNAVGASLFGSDMPIASGAAQWEYAREVAPRMAEDLQKAADSKQPLSVEQVKELQEKWGDKLKNPYFVMALADEYRKKHGGTGDYSDMLNRVAFNAAGEEQYRESDNVIRNAFTNSIGTAMVLSTGGVNASGANGLATSEGYAEVKAALRGSDGRTIAQIESDNTASFIETGTKRYSHLFSGERVTLRGYDVFTQATGYAASKNPDLAFGKSVYEGGDNSLAAKLVQYDHEHKRGLATATALDDQSDLYSLAKSTQADKTALEQSRDPLQSLYLLSDTPNSMQTEGFASSYHQLAVGEQSRLDAVRGFLQQETSFEVNGDWDRDGHKSNEKIPMARYLTGSRNYGGKRFRGFIDNGDAFGAMIEDVTHPLDEDARTILGGASGQAANSQAKIVGEFVAGYQDGLDFDGDKEGDQDKFGATNWKLRSHAGTILGPWIESFAEMDSDNAGKPVVAARDAVGAGRGASFRLSPKLRDSLYAKGGLFTDLAFDNPKQISGQDTLDPFDDRFEGGRPPAHTVIQAAAYASYKDDLIHAMANRETDPQKWQRGVAGAVNKWGGLFEHLAGSTTGVEGLRYEEIAQRNKVIRAGIDAMTSIVPIPGPKIVDVLASAAIKEGENALLAQLLPTDFTSQVLDSAINSHYSASETVADTLVETYSSRADWPNPEHKSKAELISEFLREEEEFQNDPVKRDKNGNFPPYGAMREEQQERFRSFLKERTYLEQPLEAADKTTFTHFAKMRIAQR